MKPTSVIFLIVSVFLVIGGFATAGVAKQLAASEGIVLTDEISEEAGGYIYSYEYGKDSIGRITVNVKEADVNIIGGAEKAYVELVNFPEGMYEFSSSNRILSIKNNTDLSDLSNIANLAMNFRGLRSFVGYLNMRSLPKTVNIYISGANPVKIVDCQIQSGNVTLKNCDAPADYNISIGEGNLSVSGIDTKSALNVTVGNGNADISKCDISKLAVKVEKGTVTAEAMFDTVEAKIGKGDFNYNSYGSVGLTKLALFSSIGNITLDGVKHGGYFESSDIPTDNIIDIDIGEGDINIVTMVPRG